jgi:hypothetical protein
LDVTSFALRNQLNAYFLLFIPTKALLLITLMKNGADVLKNNRDIIQNGRDILKNGRNA